MKITITLALTLSLVGCALPNGGKVDTEYLAVARTALAAIERVPSKEAIIAGPEIGANAKAALVKLGRTIVEPEAVPDKEKYVLPPGYQLLRKFDISAETAIFEITRGSIERASGLVVSHCGHTETLALARKAGEWKISKHTGAVC